MHIAGNTFKSRDRNKRSSDKEVSLKRKRWFLEPMFTGIRARTVTTEEHDALRGQATVVKSKLLREATLTRYRNTFLSFLRHRESVRVFV